MSYKQLGMMIDCSRNGVIKPEKVKEFAKLIRDMGYNMLQLYTEDTYEIEGEPFFGHMRGRYSQDELRDIDAYCKSIGIELVPCIQVLAHLNQLTQWPVYQSLFDCHDILMAGEEAVYELIEKMFVTLEKCFTSRTVNIGMDEAHFLGRGKYQDKHGHREHIDIFLEHLSRVKQIAEKHGFSIMMWSDMFIRIHNSGQYEACRGEVKLPQETIDKVPEGVELIYWCYNSKDEKHYDNLLQAHAKFHNPIGFAGGIHTWTGYAPNLRISLDATEAAMRSIQNYELNTLLFTVWGDNGKDCSYFSALPVMFASVKMAEGCFDREKIAQEFANQYGYTFEEFMMLELANITKDEPSHYHNPSKYLLLNDPFIGIYDFTVNEELTGRYEQAAQELATIMNGRTYDYLFDVQKKLLDVLACKADLGARIRKAYQTNNREVLEKIVEKDFPYIHQALDAFAEAFRRQWLCENKAFGLEVQELRIGGLMYRLKTCEARLKAYLNGEIERIDELEEQALVKFEGLDGEAVAQNNWSTTVTTSAI